MTALSHVEETVAQSEDPGAAAWTETEILKAPDATTFLPDIWEYLIEKYQIESVLDVGAGAGWATKWFVDKGIYTLGVECSKKALERNQARSNIVMHDYSTGPFIPSTLRDLAWCADVVEYIEEEFIPNFMASFNSCQYVCLAHAGPRPNSSGRVNCQSIEYWIGKMREFGFDFESAETDHLRLTHQFKPARGRSTLAFFKRRN